MKKVYKIIAFLLALTMLLPVIIACRKDTPEETLPGTESETDALTEPDESTGDTFIPDPNKKGVVTAPEKDAKIYNIIFALATVPPVLAALDSISGGYETYAIIERGKTYNGIEKIENFNNAGFDPANNLSTGFTSTEFNAMVEKVKELRAAEENSFFYFYAQDGTALRAAAIAANAGIPLEDFHVIMCEDGTGAYVALEKNFIKNKSTLDGKDEPYDAFEEVLNTAGANFTEVMSKQTNKNSDEALKYDIKSAFALSVLPNFTYWLQDKSNVYGILSDADGSKLPGIFGVDGFENETSMMANLRFQTISEKISTLSEKQKSDYLTLMYGDYYADTYAALTRTERAGEAAPAEKLVYIGARHSYYPKFASDAKYGIGGLAKTDAVPATYAELDGKYKNSLLFATEADYNAFLAVINDPANYPEGAPEDVITEIKAECFNLYINYIYTMKFTYLLYGMQYDIILKGHPREVIGAYGEWGNRYAVKRTEGEGETAKETKYVYDKLLDNALLAFHASDSVGRFIGMVPYGTAAENLAYLGVEIKICGLPSSTYSGYDPDVDVLFITAETDEAIDGDASQVKDRYAAGTLTYSTAKGEENAVFYNTGNTYKYAAQILKNAGDMAAGNAYEELFLAWLKANRPEASDIDAQGFAK